jgi:hypothetical protein
MATKKGKGSKKIKISDLKATKGGSVMGGSWPSSTTTSARPFKRSDASLRPSAVTGRRSG